MTDANLTPYEELTDKRQQLLNVVTAEFGTDTEFARSHLNAVLYKYDVSSYIEDDDEEEEATIQTTTDLLNKIVEEDAYLKKTQQGGDTSFVIDTEADEEQGEKVTGTTPSEVSDLAHQVLNRHGVSADLSQMDFGNWNEVVDKVNGRVSKRVLMIKSTPNKYRLRGPAAASVQQKL